jgi:hypothetical protein
VTTGASDLAEGAAGTVSRGYFATTGDYSWNRCILDLREQPN